MNLRNFLKTNFYKQLNINILAQVRKGAYKPLASPFAGAYIAHMCMDIYKDKDIDNRGCGGKKGQRCIDLLCFKPFS